MRSAALNRQVPGADVWADANTFADLRAAMVRFLRGDVRWTPGHGGALDEETDEIVPYLERYNLGGFMTDGSQPTAKCEESNQVAYVSGFASERVAQRIGALAELGSLGVVLTAPNATGSRGAYGDLFPFIEGHPSPEWVSDVWGGYLNWRAFRDLKECWYVVAFDTNDRHPWRLWRTVFEAVEGPPLGSHRLFPVESPTSRRRLDQRLS